MNPNKSTQETNLIRDIDTPAVVLNLKIVKENINTYQKYCDDIGITLRPHIKTHKIPALAKIQIRAGAIGITAQKISEAEAIISEGEVDDVLITYNIIGEKKLNALLNLAKKVKVTVVADSSFCVQGLSKTFKGSKEPLSVLVECDTGANRCGVTSPQEASELAELINRRPGLIFGGLMTYPPSSQSQKINNFLTDAKKLIEAKNIAVNTVSIGGSPDMWKVKDIPVATEYRIGTYIFNDRSLVEKGICSEDRVALTVLATVVSTPTKNRAIIDAGSKVLTTDLFGMKGHGRIVNFPDLRIVELTEEHGTIVSDQSTNLEIGQKIQIIPNHACVVTNMLDEVTVITEERNIENMQVVGRGKVW
ncbi:alanine racemase [Paracoccaceae bacterium]|nr:alanine racemase [Paracoccaceae bacterium]